MFERGRHQQHKLGNKRARTSQTGLCVCPQCNYSVSHQRGVPCVSMRCPYCNIPLLRQNNASNSNEHQFQSPEPQNTSFPQVNTERCVGCGACIKACPADAIILENGKAKIRVESCRNCRACVEACKLNAIS